MSHLEEKCPSCGHDWLREPPARKPDSDYYDCTNCKSTFLRPVTRQDPGAEDAAYAAKVQACKDRWYATACHPNMTFKKRWPWTKSPFERLLKEMAEYNHNYDTICHALAAAALAAAWSMNRTKAGGISGFQAGYVMWMFVRHWGHYESKPLKITDFSEMLYPQNHEQFAQTLTPECWAWLQEAATEMLKVHKDPHPDVKAHWERVAAGEAPFGYTVKEA